MVKLPTNCLSVFYHFVILVLKELMDKNIIQAKILTRVRFNIDEYTLPFMYIRQYFLRYSVYTIA